MASTRSASLRAAHARSCPNANRSAIDSTGNGSGCACQPSFFTLHRDAAGNPVKGPRVRDRQTAERALRKLLVQIDEGRVGVGRKDTATTFREWADGYEAILTDGGRRNSTIRAYRPTLEYGRDAFGALPLRAIGNEDLRRFVRAIRDNKATDATVSKHLRHLGAVLEQAVEDGKLDANPVPRFRRRLELRVPRGTPSYSDAELARLWATMVRLKYADVYVAVCKFATVTGARIGELVALDWTDVDLGNRQIRILHTWDPLDGMQQPKDGEPRTVYLVPAAVTLLEAWVATQGAHADGPVFPAPRSGERLNRTYLAKIVATAVAKAGIPKNSEDGRPRKPLHSLRASFTRIMREAGVDPAAVQFALGHSSVDTSELVYGKWRVAALRRTADDVDQAVFPV
jgi:integrase